MIFDLIICDIDKRSDHQAVQAARVRRAAGRKIGFCRMAAQCASPSFCFRILVNWTKVERVASFYGDSSRRIG